METPHPWRRLREAAHVTLVWHDGGPKGWTYFATATVSLRRGLHQAERRCTLQHELIHLERGPVGGERAAQEEQRVRRETARRMVPDVRALGEALAWAHNEHEAADELAVDVGVLRDRLASLHPAELGYLRDRLSH